MLNALIYQKYPFLTQISKRSTPTDLHHPDLHLAHFFSLESLKIFSAYAKTSLGLKMEKFLQTIRISFHLRITSYFTSKGKQLAMKTRNLHLSDWWRGGMFWHFLFLYKSPESSLLFYKNVPWFESFELVTISEACWMWVPNVHVSLSVKHHTALWSYFICIIYQCLASPLMSGLKWLVASCSLNPCISWLTTGKNERVFLTCPCHKI